MRWPLFFLTVFILVLTTPGVPGEHPRTSSPGKGERLQEIRNAIHTKGAQWTAGHTAVSGLPREEKMRLTGAIPIAPADEFAHPPFPLPDLPAYLNWSDRNGFDWTAPVKDQGLCGACVSFGSIGPLESLLNLASGDAAWDRDLSEQHLFSCGGGKCKRGWDVESSMSFLAGSGVADEICFPYLSEDGNNRSCDLTCFNSDEHLIRSRDWKWVENNVTAMKYFLLQGPITTCMTVYEDFFYYNSGVYEHVWGDYIYGHCITLIGWDDALECWICKNSWGIFWGEDGFFKIKWHDSGLGNSTAVMELYPVVRLFVDREQVSPGNSLVLGVGLYNTGPELDARLRAVLETPGQAEYEFFSTDMAIVEGMNYTDVSYTSLTVPDLSPGVYSLYLDLVDAASDLTVSFDRKEIIVE
jgi:hypothetical protein